MNSTTHTDETVFDELQNDDQARENMEILAERDDHLGALARIVLAIADDDRPDPADCEAAGLSALNDIVEEGSNVN